MVRSLKQTDAEQLVDRRTYDRIAASRAEKTFTTIEDVWRRAGVPMATLYHIAAADGFHGLGFSRRDAAWAIKCEARRAAPPNYPIPSTWRFQGRNCRYEGVTISAAASTARS
jgi:hypothetical protein